MKRIENNDFLFIPIDEDPDFSFAFFGPSRDHPIEREIGRGRFDKRVALGWGYRRYVLFCLSRSESRQEGEKLM